jgi:hypothetical protein
MRRADDETTRGHECRGFWRAYRREDGLPRLTQLLLISAVATSIGASGARAGFVEANISSYLNGNIGINPQDFPVGLSDGNTGTGIPFNTCAYGNNGYMGAAFLAGQTSPGTSSTLTVDLSSLNISGQASFYALLNNYYGTPGADEYTVTVNFAGGQSESYSAIGGVNTRDFNENPATDNTIAATTTNWWTNEAALGPSSYQRLDVREFVIDPVYQSLQIESFAITQLDANDPAFLSGLTFSDQTQVDFQVPEPASLALFGTAMAGIAASRSR